MSTISQMPSTSTPSSDRLSSLTSDYLANIAAMLPPSDLIELSRSSKTIQKSIEAFDKTFWGPYTKQQNLKKGAAEITTLISTTFRDLSSLTALELPHRGITELPFSIIKLPNLKSLNLEGNALVQIPSCLSACIAITALNLSHNPLQVWPKAVSSMLNLTKLNLCATELSSLPIEDILKMRKLEILNLSKNNLSGLFPGELMTLPNLKQLELQGNRYNDASTQIFVETKLKSDKDQIDMVSVLSEVGVFAWDHLTLTMSISPWGS